MTEHSAPESSERVVHYVDQHAPVLVLRFDSTGRVIKANEYARRLLGNPEGRQFRDIFVDFDDSLDLKMLTAGAAPRQLDVARAGNVPVTHLCHVEELDGEYLVCGAVDLSEYERLQEQILELNRELGNNSRELHKRNAELAVLNKQKDHFLGMAAHDLRKPVGLIATYADFLIDEAADQLDEEHTGFVQTIRDMSRSMSRLIDDFLDVSVIESGRLELHLERESLRTVIQRACTLLAPAAKRNDVTLDAQSASTLPEIEMDAAKIEQVVANLLSNAIAHSPPGGVVSIRAVAEKSRQTVSVSDQGAGIPKEQQRNLFKPFARGQESARRGDRSIGLGLAISKAIVDAHKGTLYVQSQPQKGSTFVVEMPLAQPINKQ